MKTILFFSRCQLTDLYAALSLKLKDDFNVIHVAYSLEESNTLNNYGINCDYIYQDLVGTLLNEDFDEELNREIDCLIIKESNGRFNVNSSIQSDRGFNFLTYEEALLLAQSQYKVWNEIFEKHKIDFFYHEPPSLFMNHIASILCLRHNASYCYDSMVKGEDNYNYLFLMQDTAFSPEINKKMISINEVDIENNKQRIQNFLFDFRESYNIYFGDKFSIQVNYLHLFIRSVKFFIRNNLVKSKVDRLRNNIDYYLLQHNDHWNKLKNLVMYKIYLKFEDLDINRDYYYYSMNLEPESTVLYLGDGIYENQIKLIMNIASQLPSNTFLYVKDHPHFLGYRSFHDYLKLMRVPNIKVLKAEIPGKKIIKDCLGVFLINGTAGFEAAMLNKHVYTFGNMFYNIFERIHYIKNIKDLREVVYKNHNVKYKDDEKLFKFILAFLDSTNKGVTDFFQGRMLLYDIDHEENIDNIAKDLTYLFNNHTKIN